MQVIATRKKDTKNFVQYESTQQGVIFSLYMPKAELPQVPPEAVTVHVSWQAVQGEVR
jgi:hypothetical protein